MARMPLFCGRSVCRWAATLPHDLSRRAWRVLLPSPRQVHARNLRTEGDQDLDQTCAGAVFLSGRMSCVYVPDLHEVWTSVGSPLTMGECGPTGMLHLLHASPSTSPRISLNIWETICC